MKTLYGTSQTQEGWQHPNMNSLGSTILFPTPPPLSACRFSCPSLPTLDMSSREKGLTQGTLAFCPQALQPWGWLLSNPHNHSCLSVRWGGDGLGSAAVTPQRGGYTYLGTNLDWDFRCNPMSSGFAAAFKVHGSKDGCLKIPTAYHPRRPGDTKGISSAVRACAGCTETCKDQVAFPAPHALINREATTLIQCIFIH